jgi:hypothetical protein
MNTSQNSKNFIQEFREFAKFLQSLWGILASLSVLFPLSNVFAKVIPLGVFDQDGGFVFFPLSLVTAMATLASFFIILSTFGQRHALKSHEQQSFFKRQASISFALGVFALIIYVGGHFVVLRGLVYGYYERTATYFFEQLIGDVILLVTYCGFFALMTRAFELLAMLEYFA